MDLVHGILFFLAVLPLSSSAPAAPPRRSVHVITLDDLKDTTPTTSTSTNTDDSPDWDDFNDPDQKPPSSLDPGSWRHAMESTTNTTYSVLPSDSREIDYLAGIQGIFLGEDGVDEAVGFIDKSAAEGFAHAQSVLGFCYGSGVGTKMNRAKAMVYHQFAANGGNAQSKLALAYNYFRQAMHEKAVEYYSELAEASVASFMISKDQPVLEIIRIHNGAEENKEALKKFRGEADEGFQVLEHQALRGNPGAMYQIGMFYYFGMRGVPKDNSNALHWFVKAVEKGEPKSMELLGEMYASGTGVKKNYTKALEWLTLSSQQHHSSAFNGLGYLYVKGYGVEKNYTKAKLYFEKAAANKAGGFYNLGVLFLKGIGVKKDVTIARNHFLTAGNAGHPKALYQLAKMFEKGIGLKKNLAMASVLYKVVAERGPWNSLSSWALEFYLKGDVRKALLIYLRMAELGYEVAQSNAAWVLDKYEENSMCIGESGLCTSAERHLLQHSLWWQASEQGNEHAALLIGDAYYYGRGMDKDYERAAEAYMHAQSQSNSQAMFNLGYMHERGEGLPLDLHLAKRYYDQALEHNLDARLAVTLALTSLWVRKNYNGGFLVNIIDSLPELFPRIEVWVEEKTLGWVSKVRTDKQAKLGEDNKFYYDENLKRWVEKGVDPLPEEAAPPPPPIMTSFQDGQPDYNVKSALKTQNSLPNEEMVGKPPMSLQHNSSIPSIPPSQNQFSMRGRMGVRSRYVDTFNKGAERVTGSSSFLASANQSIKPIIGGNFFVPTPLTSASETAENSTPNICERSSSGEVSSVEASTLSHYPPLASYSMQKFSSMDTITNLTSSSLNTIPSRATSWSGSISDEPDSVDKHHSSLSSDSKKSKQASESIKETRDISQTSNGGFGDDLQEVNL